MKKLLHNFLSCGLIGWCAEIIYTSLQSFRHHDLRLLGTTSLWMFPIYGCGFLLIIPYKIFQKTSLFFRGLIYMFCIFSGEYFSGYFLTKYNACPWNYENCKLHIKKLIRLDYAPFWFLLGLFMEKTVFCKSFGQITKK